MCVGKLVKRFPVQSNTISTSAGRNTVMYLLLSVSSYMLLLQTDLWLVDK